MVSPRQSNSISDTPPHASRVAAFEHLMESDTPPRVAAFEHLMESGETQTAYFENDPMLPESNGNDTAGDILLRAGEAQDANIDTTPFDDGVEFENKDLPLFASALENEKTYTTLGNQPASPAQPKSQAPNRGLQTILAQLSAKRSAAGATGQSAQPLNLGNIPASPTQTIPLPPAAQANTATQRRAVNPSGARNLLRKGISRFRGGRGQLR